MKRIFAAIAAFLMVIVLCACGAEEVAENQNTSAATTQPIEAPAYPTLLTYADYMKMTPEQQQAYYDTFPDMDTYIQWFNAAALAHNQGSSSGKEEVSGNEGQITQPPAPEESIKPATPPDAQPQVSIPDPEEDEQSSIPSTQPEESTEETKKPLEQLDGYGEVGTRPAN